MITIEDYIQNPVKRHILGKLLDERKLRYSELMPNDVDNVLFNYHLQHLVKTGILDKDENRYSLSKEGLKVTANVTSSGIYFPKFVCRYRLYLIHDDCVLLQHRKRTCWHGDTSSLSSKVVFGVPTEERADIRMMEKAGIKTNMKWVGTIRTLVFNSKKDLVDDSFYFVCYATSYEGTLKQQDDSDDPLGWYSFEDAIEMEKKNRSSGEKTVEILTRFKNKNFTPFCFEETTTSEEM